MSKKLLQIKSTKIHGENKQGIILKKKPANRYRVFIRTHDMSLFLICRRLKGIHSRSKKNRTGAEGLSFYYPMLLHCLDQMLAVVLLSQHRVSSSKIVRPRGPCGARCIEHAIRTWSAVWAG